MNKLWRKLDSKCKKFIWVDKIVCSPKICFSLVFLCQNLQLNIQFERKNTSSYYYSDLIDSPSSGIYSSIKPLHISLQINNGIAIVISVTRWWNKSCLISPKNAQKVVTHLLHNSHIIRNSPKKSPKYLGYFCETMLFPRTCKNRPIWSHWSWSSPAPTHRRPNRIDMLRH